MDAIAGHLLDCLLQEKLKCMCSLLPHGIKAMHTEYLRQVFETLESAYLTTQSFKNFHYFTECATVEKKIWPQRKFV